MPGIAATNSSTLPHRYFGAVLSVIVVATLSWSAVHPVDWLTWWMEVSWVLVGFPIVAWLALRYGITRILLVLLTMHAVILVIGGHYTYEKVPAGLWVQEWFDLARNDYDRLGHFVQGFVPALIARELLRRTSPLQPGRWIAILCIASALAFSAIFEMIEWGSSVALGASADAFLGTQGDPWDAQWDMLCALIGAICSMATLSRLHERELRRMHRA
jgi:putative membrane protein